MGDKTVDVVALGNAMVDVLVKADDAFVASLGFQKGTMTMLDEEKAKNLFDYFSTVSSLESTEVDSTEQMSGGSAANVAAAISSLGKQAAFMGRVSADVSGKRFIEKLQERKIEVSVSEQESDKSTGRCLVVVTPDGARTMMSHIGISLVEEDVQEALIEKSKFLFLTAFLWDGEDTKKAALKAIAIAKEKGTKIAFGLADEICVGRHKDEFTALIASDVDVLFGNRAEVSALYGGVPYQEAVTALAKELKENHVAALTCGAEGALVISQQGQVAAAAEKVETIIDTTGVGSLFVAGFLSAYIDEYSLELCGTLANQAAAEGLQYLGARPKASLEHLLTSLAEKKAG